MRSRMDRIPVRVGLIPIRSSTTSDPGTIEPATRKKAAEEMSAGTSTSSSFRFGLGQIVTAPSPRSIFAPAASSMTSVWSRVASGSITVVGPSARRPAISRQDLTWALATGSSYSMPWSARPSIRIGGKRPSVTSISAPIRRRGSAIRSTGRVRIEASPFIRQSPPS